MKGSNEWMPDTTEPPSHESVAMSTSAAAEVNTTILEAQTSVDEGKGVKANTLANWLGLLAVTLSLQMKC